MKEITLYTDGSSLGNPGPGGYCGILVYKDTEKIIQGGEPMTTNNRMELLSVIESLKVLKQPCKIALYTDSQYVCNAINQWLTKWVQNNFKKVKNIDLWKEYLNLSQKHSIIAHWIKGHNGHAMNERCDKIAREQAQSFALHIAKTNK